MQTGLCRSEPSLWPGPSPRTGKRISDARDEGPQSASGRSSFPAETANGPLHPPQTAENRGYSAETGNSGLAQDCVVGLGGLEPATRRLSRAARSRFIVPLDHDLIPSHSV